MTYFFKSNRISFDLFIWKPKIYLKLKKRRSHSNQQKLNYKMRPKNHILKNNL